MRGDGFVVVSDRCAADARLALLLHVLALWIMDQISEVLVLVHVLLKYCLTGYAWLSFAFECACLSFCFWFKCALLSFAIEYAWVSFAFECAWVSFALESDTATSHLVRYNVNADTPISVLCWCHRMSVRNAATKVILTKQFRSICALNCFPAWVFILSLMLCLGTAALLAAGDSKRGTWLCRKCCVVELWT